MATQRFGPTVVESAAESTEELGFLSAIMDDQLDEAPKLVYADWLEERDDPRGTFLREFVRLARTPGTPLPSGDQFPYSWRQVVGIQPLHLIRETLAGEDTDVDIEALEQDLMRRLQPTLYLLGTPAKDKDFPPGATKFGGRPDLPPDVEWPADSDHEADKPIAGIFCAQVRLSDLRGTLAGLKLPTEGLMSFFADAQRVPVRYFRSEAGPFVRRPPPAARDRAARFNKGFFPLPTRALRVIEGADFLIRYHADLWPTGVLEENWEGLEFLADAMLPRPFRFGGGDYVAHHQLLGNGSEPNGSSGPDMEPGFCRLAWFDSEHGDSFDWAEGGKPVFYIAKEDLASGRFENAISFCG